jgi:hypothetical protein
MEKRYHLIIEQARPDHSHLNPAVMITLVDTLDFNPVFEIRTLANYQHSIESLVRMRYKDDVKTYSFLEKVNYPATCDRM